MFGCSAHACVLANVIKLWFLANIKEQYLSIVVLLGSYILGLVN